MSRFVFDGINSELYNVNVFPTDSLESAPARQYTSFVVPGRSGALFIDEHRYNNISITYGIIIDSNGKSNFDALKNAIASRVGYCRLVDSFDSDHYYMAIYKQELTPVYKRNPDATKAEIEFERKPQRFLITGETPVEFTTSGTITNPTQYSSKPLLKVYGSGVLGVGGTNITIANHGYSYIIIDCEMGRAYYEATPLDDQITLNTIDYPALEAGVNGIALGTGISKAVVTPRWWEL